MAVRGSALHNPNPTLYIDQFISPKPLIFFIIMDAC